jgi:hypothetical protein
VEEEHRGYEVDVDETGGRVKLVRKNQEQFVQAREDKWLSLK